MRRSQIGPPAILVGPLGPSFAKGGAGKTDVERRAIALPVPKRLDRDSKPNGYFGVFPFPDGFGKRAKLLEVIGCHGLNITPRRA